MTTERKTGGSRPTDQELMLFADGELEGARRDEVAAHVAADPVAKRKLAALRLTSDLVRDAALGASAKLADGIADDVMARIAAEAGPLPKPAEKVVSLDGARADRARRDEDPARAAKEQAGRSRTIFTLAAVAVAAAAAMAFWGRQPPETPVAMHDAPTAVAPPPSSAAPRPAETAKPSAPAEQGGAEVAAVDFGARTGSIFYVPSDVASQVTAVVWIDDDSAGGP